MQILEDKIIKDGIVLPGNILRVDGFINQKMDIALFNEMGKEFARLFEGKNINKILTIEASGIGIACITAQYFGNAPVVFGKKYRAANQSNDFYSAQVFSFTHKTTYDVHVSKKFLSKDDCVLIIDDFLANGEAVDGLINIVEQAGATLAGVGVAIEKAYQHGGDNLRKRGIQVESLAIIENMDNCKIKFRS